MRYNNGNSGGSGIGFLGLLTLMFIAFKILGFVEWSWVAVLSPIWIPIVIAISLILFVFFRELLRK